MTLSKFLVYGFTAFLLIGACSNEQTNSGQSGAETGVETNSTDVAENSAVTTNVLLARNGIDSLSAGDTITLSKKDQVLLVAEGNTNSRKAKIDTTVNGHENAMIIITDDMVMYRPASGGIELDTILVNTDTIQVVVSARPATPSTVNERPDYIFTLDKSTIMLDHYALKVAGELYDHGSSSTLTGVWEFGIGELNEVIFPLEAYQTGKTELWLYVDE